MTLTDDIMANTACTKAYAKNAQVVVMKADADYSSTADLVGKTIVAEAGSAGESAISEDEPLPGRLRQQVCPDRLPDGGRRRYG